jgi:hypothetical protein
MSFLDAVVGQSFRNEKAGRVVVLTGDRRHRGYLVKSPAEELKIRAFMKMYFSAHVSILVLGYFLASEWSRELAYAFGRPAAHIFRTSCISLGIYSLVVGLPYLLLWKAYRKACVSFVSVQDEVVVSGKRPARQIQMILAAVGVCLLGIAILLGVIFLIRAK